MKASLLLFTLLLSLNGHASQEAIDQIETAAMQLDTPTLLRLAKSNAGYAAALANYRLSIAYAFVGQDKPDEARAALNIAIKQVENLTKNQAEDSELWALLAQLYGLQIAYTPLQGATLGNKADHALSTAKTLQADNPRIYLVQGINTYNTPAIYGGSKKAALDALDRAIELYESDTHSEYHWGHAEAYTWRGLAHTEMGETEKAHQDWQTALQIAPHYRWAKMLSEKHQSQ